MNSKMWGTGKGRVEEGSVVNGGEELGMEELRNGKWTVKGGK